MNATSFTLIQQSVKRVQHLNTLPRCFTHELREWCWAPWWVHQRRTKWYNSWFENGNLTNNRAHALLPVDGRSKTAGGVGCSVVAERTSLSGLHVVPSSWHCLDSILNIWYLHQLQRKFGAVPFCSLIIVEVRFTELAMTRYVCWPLWCNDFCV